MPIKLRQHKNTQKKINDIPDTNSKDSLWTACGSLRVCSPGCELRAFVADPFVFGRRHTRPSDKRSVCVRGRRNILGLHPGTRNTGSGWRGTGRPRPDAPQEQIRQGVKEAFSRVYKGFARQLARSHSNGGSAHRERHAESELHVVLGGPALIVPAELQIFARNPQFAHHGVQRGAVQSQPGGSRGHYSAALFQNQQYVLPLDLLQGGLACSRTRIGPDLA